MNPRNITIKPYDSENRPALLALWSRVFPNPSAHNQPADILDEKHGFQPELIRVAWCDGELVGSVLVGYDGHRGWLNLLAVDQRLRRAGIGTALVDDACRQLTSLGCRKLNIQIRDDNQDVVNFYTRLGFLQEPRVSMGKVLGS